MERGKLKSRTLGDFLTPPVSGETNSIPRSPNSKVCPPTGWRGSGIQRESVSKDANAEVAFEEMAGGPVQLVTEHRQDVKESCPERWFSSREGL